MIDLRAVRPYADVARVRAGEQLAEEGQLCHAFLVVMDGELETIHAGTRARLRRGNSFGWDAMRDRGRNAATVVAATDAVVMVMSHAQFRAAEALVEDAVRRPPKTALSFLGPPLLPPVPPPTSQPAPSLGAK